MIQSKRSWTLCPLHLCLAVGALGLAAEAASACAAWWTHDGTAGRARPAIASPQLTR